MSEPDRLHPPDGTGGPKAGADENSSQREDPFSRRVRPLITERPKSVVLVFFALTLFFLGATATFGIDMAAGTDEYVEDIPEYDALESVEESFERGDGDHGEARAQLVIDTDGNVLSRENLQGMLSIQDELEETDRFRVASSRSPASLIAEQIDPSAETPEEQSLALREASSNDLERAIIDAETETGLPVSEDFNQDAGQAGVAKIEITYRTPPDADTDDVLELHEETVTLTEQTDELSTAASPVIFGGETLESESMQLLSDTSVIVIPAAIILILVFLALAYRDPIDLTLGVVALLMTMIWTFGFMAITRITFTDAMVPVIPLLLAVGIDFGIHTINRYREERANGREITYSMDVTMRQLMTAFIIVSLTDMFSFAANLSSGLSTLRAFAIVAGVGMFFSLLIFGIFLPAAKVAADQFREKRRIPAFGTSPIGMDGSILNRVLLIGVRIAKVVPVAFFILVLLTSLGVAGYGAGVGTTFDDEAFFPDEDRVEQFQVLPGELAPEQYTFVTYVNYLEEEFDEAFDDTVTIYVDDSRVRSDRGLTAIDGALESPADAFESDRGRAEATSILDVIDDQAAVNPPVADSRDRYDASGDGIPDRNVDAFYDDLFEHGSSEAVEDRLTSDRTETRFDVAVRPDADQTEAVDAGHDLAAEMDQEATATGQLVVFEAVVDEVQDGVLASLVIALVLTGVFLVVTYRVFEGRAIYGVLNLIPILVAVAFIAGTMRAADIPLTPINAPILSVSIGLGVDYTVHFTHRFVDEYESGNELFDALYTTVQGTGGALTLSMLTTVSGLGVLSIALIPLVAEFGVLLAIGIFYAWIASLLIVPSTVVVWTRLEERYDEFRVRESGAFSKPPRPFRR